ncbi:unnamed protein product [Bursaphelenchus xylophilus]|uniref:(pine wood nematode) hypothetical protein n=1 Tax=Bursaphelenchus xylophilus TaxID=6326 RepID=A0A1I7SSL5_BURXY|nr:unnamed protein product [Bursaphelenchus xylophilus]CAG9097429.1 unnamed protein product [Bursaphelenchus xylophilus]
MYTSSLRLTLLLSLINEILTLECFDCTNYPDGIVCSTKASCETQGGCYYASSKEPELAEEKKIPWWVSSCANNLKIENYQTSCFNTANEDTICVCFQDYCNTPAEIEKAINIRFSPFKENPLLPWALATTATTTASTSTITLITSKAIPTTLLTKPVTSTTTTIITTTVHLLTEENLKKTVETTIMPARVIDLTEQKQDANKSLAYLGSISHDNPGPADTINTTETVIAEVDEGEAPSKKKLALRLLFDTVWKMEDSSTSFEMPRDLTEAEKILLLNQKSMSKFKENKLEIEARKNWDRFYKRNQDKFFKDRHWTRNEIHDILGDLDYNKKLVFVEMGCGVGNMLFPLIEYYPHWDFFGFDFSENAIQELKKRARNSGVSITADVLDLTDNQRRLMFPEGDIATLIFVLSAIHPDKHQDVIENLKKYIKPGGIIFVRDYGAFDYAMIRFGRGAKIYDRFYARQDGTRAYYFYTQELTQLFEKAGFECQTAEYLHKKTTNHEREMTVDRIFVQCRFRRKEWE